MSKPNRKTRRTAILRKPVLIKPPDISTPKVENFNNSKPIGIWSNEIPWKWIIGTAIPCVAACLVLNNTCHNDSNWEIQNEASIFIANPSFRTYTGKRDSAVNWGFEPTFVDNEHFIHYLRFLDSNGVTDSKIPDCNTIREMDSLVERAGYAGEKNLNKMFTVNFFPKNTGLTDGTNIDVKINVESFSDSALNGIEIHVPIPVIAKGIVASAAFGFPMQYNVQLPDSVGIKLSATYINMKGHLRSTVPVYFLWTKKIMSFDVVQPFAIHESLIEARNATNPEYRRLHALPIQ